MEQNYKKLRVWHYSRELILELYQLTSKLPDTESNNLISQIRRAAISCCINIAEGSSRNTIRGNLQFLRYSYGSAKELECLIIICKDLGYLNNEEYLYYSDKVDRFLRSMFKLIGSKDFKKNHYGFSSLDKI